ncbi:Auxin-binding protein 1 precursor (ABP) [[Actinomadura] parvosata subsp. kistnae]|uniref:Cupin n=1 Tax=[Actinomadura] parvosata subsp. kistnae TaxID=1909395 RepID=A0A1V0ACX0_9ACTN|nr:AraC family ligand binding domain-containing protein [Nonomuraea sp. ATCC 55076]AQZ68047.1 cupin [Nonomuraea sp. ATCC 55076]SPL93576.1 Auxin-binding protein 1 precursor (ABP) [Actinomadura parvosata subsp. kistnae]
MSVVLGAGSRRIETPNGVMTTLASPTQGSAGQAVWRVDARPGMVGPVHAFDAELVWTWLDGSAVVELGGERYEVGAGDTMVLPADVSRQMIADAERGFVSIVVAPAGAQVYNPGGVSEPDACDLAPKDAERLVPPWVA